MADRFITLLEVANRTARVTTSGMEISTTFYVEPATAAPVVICALLGSVSGNKVTDTRTLPARDHEYPFCYCVQAHQTPLDRRAAAGGPALMDATIALNGDHTEFGGAPMDYSDVQAFLRNPIIFNGPLALDSDGSYNPDSINTPGLCGAYVEAVYRPLPTAYKFSSSPTDDEFEESFDYIDPQFHPCSRTIPTESALRVIPQFQAAGTGIGIDAGGDSFIVDTWTEFTIRRIMVPHVPWNAIQQLQGSVNGDSQWFLTKFEVQGLPNDVFLPGVLRFDAADVVKHTIPTCLKDDGETIEMRDGIPVTRPMTWWDITYTFSWRTTMGYRFDLKGKRSAKRVNLGWNDTWYGGGWSQMGFGAVKLSAGWYETGYFQSVANATFTQASPFLPKYSDTKDALVNFDGMNHPFEALFRLESA